MPRTQIFGEQVNDGGLGRDDLNIDQPGEAVIRKVIAGFGITLEETGADPGTGDVTIHSTSDLPGFVIVRSCAGILLSRNAGFILTRP
jgi:hypothetical protein